jgi:ankyrin repeat protein
MQAPASLIDISYVVHKNRLLISRPISKIASILNIPVDQLLQIFQTQYPNINWNKNKSVVEIVLPQEKIASIEEEGKAPSEKEAIQEEECQERPLKRRRLDQENPSESQMRKIANRVHIALYQGLRVVHNSKVSFAPMPLLPIHDLFEKLHLSSERRKDIKQMLKNQDDRIAFLLCDPQVSDLSESEKLKALKFLLARDVRLLRKTDALGNTPLHIAAGKTNVAATRMLANHLNRTDCQAQNSNGLTPLHIALREGRSEALFLLSFGNLTQPNRDGITPLHIVAKYGCKSSNPDEYYRTIMKHLPENFDFNTHGDCFNQTPLHYAAINANTHFIPILLKAGSQTTCRDAYGNTPLLSALKFSDSIEDPKQYAQLLTDLADEKSLFIKNHLGRNVFHYVVLDQAHAFTFDLLYQRAVILCGAEKAKVMLLEEDGTGISPAMYAKALRSPCWKNIQELLSEEVLNIKPSRKKLSCGSCRNILRDPVHLISGKVLCKGCAFKHPECKDLTPDKALQAVIHISGFSSDRGLSYNDCLLNNVSRLGKSIGKQKLSLDNNQMIVLDIDNEFQIVIKNYEPNQEPNKSRLVLSVQILKEEENQYFSLEKIKKILEKYHLDPRLAQGGFIYYQGKLVFQIPLIQRDLENRECLNNACHCMASIARSLREHFIEDKPLETKVSDSPKLASETPREIPGSHGATYYFAKDTLHLLVPIDIDLNSSQALILYLNRMDLTHFSYPIIIDGRLFRKMSVYQPSGTIDPQTLQQYVLDLKKV